jgi:hypothetical protein
VRKNVLLQDFLGAWSIVDRPKKIEDLIMRGFLRNTEEEMCALIDLLWLSILENKAFVKIPDPEDVSKNADKKDQSGDKLDATYSIDLTDTKPIAKIELNEALEQYAEALEKILLRILIESRRKIPALICEKLGYEMLCAAHLIGKPEKAHRFFASFAGYFVGHHIPMNEAGLDKRAADILRKSLKDTPLRGPEYHPKDYVGYRLEYNLLAYVVAWKERYNREDERPTAALLQGLLNVLIIALSKTDSVGVMFQALLTRAKGLNISAD